MIVLRRFCDILDSVWNGVSGRASFGPGGSGTGLVTQLRAAWMANPIRAVSVSEAHHARI